MGHDKIPETLYHGSIYLNYELAPGYMITGEHKKFEDSESNLFLYAADTAEFARFMAICSLVEDVFPIFEHFQGPATPGEGGPLICSSKGDQPIPSGEEVFEAIAECVGYIYRIDTEVAGIKWDRVRGETNSHLREYRTKNIVESQALSVHTFFVGEYLKIISSSEYPIITRHYIHDEC